jgi:hypothetical protein
LTENKEEESKPIVSPEATQNKNSLFDLKALKELGGVKAGCLVAVDPLLEPKFMLRVGRTVKHDKTTSNLVVKTGLSAYTKEPLNTFLRGGSSIGKTYVVVNSLTCFPKEDVWFLGGLSPTALVHDRGLLVDENGEPIEAVPKPEKKASLDEKEAYLTYREKLKTSHYLVELHGKILVFLEAPNIETFNKLRPVLSHDVWEISYKFTDTSQKGSLRTTHVVLRGWPATIFCSTDEKFVQDLATRSFTFTPETTEEKYRDANKLTGTKAAFPWKFEKDMDDVLLEGYITYFKEHMKELQVIVPYAEKFGNVFPAKFPRSMRDFKHVLSLIQVSALFYFVQRPVLVRKLRFETEGKEGFREEEHRYVMAVKQDYDNTMTLWKEVRETTETSAASHHLTFFHKVVEPMATLKPMFTIKDLTDTWNSLFADRKSSDTIRNYVDFLCLIGYMSKEPDPSDKRQNLLTIIQEESGKYTENELSAFFTLETFNEWLKEAQTITEENHILLRENLLADAETTPEAIYNKNFLYENRNSSVNVPSPNETPTDESAQKKAENKKNVQYPQINLDLLAEQTLKLEHLKGDFTDKCLLCGFNGRMDWQVTEHDQTWSLLCDRCGLQLEKKLGEAVEQEPRKDDGLAKGDAMILNGYRREAEP